MVSVTCFTDPLCCWSWAMQMTFDRLKTQFGDMLQWRDCMGGLLPSWDAFFDTVNAVSRPVQMGPVWMHAAQVGGVPIDYSIWVKDPPQSSYLACMAYKAVQFQSQELASAFLYRMRESCLMNGINISRQAALVKLARCFQKEFPGFDVKKFEEHLVDGTAREAFRADLNETVLAGITRFPTFIIGAGENRRVMISGFKTFEEIYEIIATQLELAVN